MVLVSVVLGAYNRLSFLQLTIDSVRAEIEGLPHEIVVVDGGSDDGTIPWLMAQKDIITIVQHNRGEWQGRKIERRPWGYFMNLGFRAACGKYVCMLSDDCLVVPGAIRNGLKLIEEKRADGNNVGAVAFYWRNWPEQDSYWVGLALGGRMFVNHGLYYAPALREVDYIDERYSFYHGDADLCLKMWAAGYTCIDSPDSYIEHFSHANGRVRRENLSSERKDWESYLAKWEGTFYRKGDQNCGTWIEKVFENPHGTAERFRGIAKHVGLLKARSKIRRNSLVSKAIDFVRGRYKVAATTE